jgi:iron complex outermembrane receptor protein
VTTPYRIGLNSTATPGIKPEKSRSFTLGAVFQPTPWFSMTADYFNIRKTDVILAGPDYGTALANFYAGKPLPTGYTVTLNGADPDFPNGARTVAFVNSPYVNGASQKVSGIDVTALLQLKLAPRVKFSSQIEVTDLFHSTQTTEAGTSEWVGTQGPYQLSSGAGTPKWRGNWSNSLEWGPATLTATAYYTSGYKSTADDVSGPGTAGDCANAIKDVVFCHTKRFIDVDLVGSYQVNPHFSVYFNVTNLFDSKAPINPANYAVLNYNPTWSQQGAIGRSFRVGAKVNL